MADKTADIKTQTTEPTKPAQSSTVTVNLHNPTTARRIIYDGIEGSQKSIEIEAGATKKNVVLHRHIADELRARTRAHKDHDSDLHVLPASEDAETTAS